MKISAHIAKEIRPNLSPWRRSPFLRKIDPRLSPENKVIKMIGSTVVMHCESLSMAKNWALLAAVGRKRASQLPNKGLRALANEAMKRAKAICQYLRKRTFS